MIKFISGALLILLTLLSGCSRISNSDYFQSRRNAYLTSKNGADIVLPQGTAQNKISHFYDIPDPKGQPMVSVVPPGSKVKDHKRLHYVPAIADADIEWQKQKGMMQVNSTVPQTHLMVASALKRQGVEVNKVDDQKYQFEVVLKNKGDVQRHLLVHLKAKSRTTQIQIVNSKGGTVAPAVANVVLEKLYKGMRGKHLWQDYIVGVG